jgi:hypothetical protein
MAFQFLSDDGQTSIYLDDVCLQGKCLGYDAPEPGTWLLLAATAAFGGFVRRRRRT